MRHWELLSLLDNMLKPGGHLKVKDFFVWKFKLASLPLKLLPLLDKYIFVHLNTLRGFYTVVFYSYVKTRHFKKSLIFFLMIFHTLFLYNRLTQETETAVILRIKVKNVVALPVARCWYPLVISASVASSGPKYNDSVCISINAETWGNLQLILCKYFGAVAITSDIRDYFLAFSPLTRG